MDELRDELGAAVISTGNVRHRQTLIHVELTKGINIKATLDAFPGTLVAKSLFAWHVTPAAEESLPGALIASRRAYFRAKRSSWKTELPNSGVHGIDAVTEIFHLFLQEPEAGLTRIIDDRDGVGI